MRKLNKMRKWKDTTLTKYFDKRKTGRTSYKLFSLNCTMLFKKIFLVSLLSAAGTFSVQAQINNFCDGVNAVMNDAPNNFNNILGRMMESNMTATMWSSTIKIPGVIGYRIVNSMGYFYEGAFIQTTNKDDIKPVYEEYKKKLNDCLSPLGYKFSTQENFTAGISEFRKMVFMKDVKPGTEAKDLPPHVTVEATYNKDIGKFTLVMFIFNH